MNCATISRLCRAIAKGSRGTLVFLGCVTAEGIMVLNRIHDSDKRLHFVIANILHSSDPQQMGHWVFFGKQEGKLVYFDSFAFDPGSYSDVFGQLTKDYRNRRVFFNISKRLHPIRVWSLELT